MTPADKWERQLSLLDRIYITGLNILVSRGDSMASFSPDPWKAFTSLWDQFSDGVVKDGWLPEPEHPLHGRLFEKIVDVRGLMSSLEKCCKENMDHILTVLPQLRSDNKSFQTGKSQMVNFKS